jgi:hypothetical protein
MAICAATRSSPLTASVTGMLDLDPRVHLEKVELATLAVDEELDGARAAVTQSASRSGRRLPASATSGLVQQAARVLLR